MFLVLALLACTQDFTLMSRCHRSGDLITCVDPVTFDEAESACLSMESVLADPTIEEPKVDRDLLYDIQTAGLQTDSRNWWIGWWSGYDCPTMQIFGNSTPKPCDDLYPFVCMSNTVVPGEY